MDPSKYKNVRFMLSNEQRIIFNKVTLLSHKDIDILWSVFKNTKTCDIKDSQKKHLYNWLAVLRIYTEDKPIDQLIIEQKIGQPDALNL